MNAYDILGIDENVSDKELKKKYRSLAQKYHPDKNPGNAAAEKKFKEIGEAYSILSDLQKRAEHDAMLHMQNIGGRNFGGHYGDNRLDPNAIFDELFSRGGLGGFEHFFRGAGQSRTRYQSNIELTLFEAARGVRKSIVLPGSPPMEIAIPPGIENGEILEVPVNRLTSMHLHVNVRRHPIFSRHGVNLHAKIDVPVQIALGGGEINVPTLSGKSKLKIPPGTGSHAKLRIAGAGIRRGAELGAIYYELRITMPGLTSEQISRCLAIIDEKK